MGIHHLMKLIIERAKEGVREIDLKSLTGKIVAVDASMTIYQHLIATISLVDQSVTELTDKEGNPTSHIFGILYKSLRLIENGIKPIFVFDGKPPNLKRKEIEKRVGLKKEAEEEKKIAQSEENVQMVKKLAGRSIHVTPKMIEDAKKLLTLMGFPVVQAPSEAEAQCAALCKAGKVYGVITDDMDCLTFGSPIQIRGKKKDKDKKSTNDTTVIEINLEKVLHGFGLTYKEFIDLCILCGCDYTTTIEGIGPVKALKYISQCKDIEKVIYKISVEKTQKNKTKYTLPQNFLYKESREYFLKPETIDPKQIELKWEKVNEVELKKFLVEEKNGSEVRVDAAIKRLLSAKKSTQSAISSFFTNVITVKSNVKGKEQKKPSLLSQKKASSRKK